MRRLLLALTLLVAVLLAGCNPGVSSDAAAKAFIGALFNGNAQAARDVMCEQAKPLITDEAVRGLAQGQIDVSGLSYSVRDATDTTANVVVSGDVRIGPAGEQQQQADFATIGGSLTLLPAVVENQAWKICPSTLNL